MKILFGVQATGNGHISRARCMVRELKSLGHDVQVLFSGRDPSHLWDMEIFGDYKVYRGLTFVVENGKINSLKTALRLGLIQFYRDISKIQNQGYDCVISDFEPITARLAKRWNLPSLGIGHQYAFEFDIPKITGGFHQHWILKNFAPVDIPLGLHWHPFGQPIFPPIVPTMEKGQSIRNQYLVYLPFENWESKLSFLHNFGDFQFQYFCPVKEIKKIGNVTLNPYGRQEFIDAMISCEGVITSAGFELASEAFQLGKKVLACPISGQFEQECNGQALNLLGWGKSIRTWDVNEVESFLLQESPAPRQYPNVARLLAEWISAGDWDHFEPVSRMAWKQVNLS